MSPRFRLDPPHDDPWRRVSVGLLVSSECSEAAAAAVEIPRRVGDARPGILAFKSARVPEETAGLFAQLSGGSGASLSLLSVLRTMLSDFETALVSDLLADLPLSEGTAVALGVHDPGLWNLSPGRATSGYLGLCDPARLAEATGLNVIDAFPARDLARGGQGGPLTALPEWMLLQDPERTRVLLKLGQTIRLSYLPATRIPGAASRILAFDVGPGTRLLDLLTLRFSGGQQRFDAGGRLAVQGRQIPELVRHWLADPYFDRPLPRWHPRGVRPERFLADALQMAVAAGWSVRDLLCTATHFIAETIAIAVHRRLPDDVPVDQIVVTGGAQQNGLLLREITARLPKIPLVRASDLGIAGEALGPACIALLAALWLEQVPANSASVTGADTPCVLGRLTPGSTPNWQRLAHLLAGGSRPAVRPLHSTL